MYKTHTYDDPDQKPSMYEELERNEVFTPGYDEGVFKQVGGKENPIYPPEGTIKENQTQTLDGSFLQIIDGVFFVEVKNPSLSVVYKKDMNSFTGTVDGNYQSNKTEYHVNLQQYDIKDLTSYLGIFPQLGTTSPFVTLGQNVHNGKTTGLPTDNKRAYFAKNKNGTLTAGLGNPPKNSSFGIGGGIPMLINGQKYGEKNTKTTKAASGYANQNSVEVGKVVIGYNSKNNTLILVVSPDELEVGGMTLDQIRDRLISLGYNNIMSFDGGSSATLIKDKKVIVTPDWKKDNTIPAGLKVTEQ